MTSEALQDFTVLYREYRKMVRGVIYNICGANNLDDLVQETFLRLWKGLPRFKRSAQPKTWLYRIAVNTALDHYRRQKKHWADTELTADLPASDTKQAAVVYQDLIQKGLAKLTDEHRAVLVLTNLEDLPIREVAEILNTSEGTVKSRLHYARKQLAEFLEREGITL